MKNLLALLWLFISINASGQAFKLLPTEAGATYATFHGAVIKPDSAGAQQFWYWITPFHQMFTDRFTQSNVDFFSDSFQLYHTTVYGLECNQKYYVTLFGFATPYGDPYAVLDSFYTLDTIGCTTGIKESIAAFNGVKIIPNPVSYESKIVMPSAFTGLLSVYDITGRIAVQVAIVRGDGVLRRSDLLPGVYYYRTAFDDKLYSGKLIVQ